MLSHICLGFQSDGPQYLHLPFPPPPSDCSSRGSLWEMRAHSPTSWTHIPQQQYREQQMTTKRQVIPPNVARAHCHGKDSLDHHSCRASPINVWIREISCLACRKACDMFLALSGIYMQHCTSVTAQVPPCAAVRMSRALQFCNTTSGSGGLHQLRETGPGGCMIEGSGGMLRQGRNLPLQSNSPRGQTKNSQGVKPPGRSFLPVIVPFYLLPIAGAHIQGSPNSSREVGPPPGTSPCPVGQEIRPSITTTYPETAHRHFVRGDRPHIGMGIPPIFGPGHLLNLLTQLLGYPPYYYLPLLLLYA
nr:PREDICTED: uncharacterized protein LOC103546564 [Equus przewalskii]